MKHFFLGVLCTLASSFAASGLAVAGNNNGPDFGGSSSAAAAANQAQGQLQGQAQGQLQGQAQGNFNVVAPSQSTSVSNRNDNTNFNSSKSESGAAALSGSSSKSGAFSGGNSQSVTFTDSGKVDYSGSYTVKNVPNVGVGSLFPTAPCMGSTSVSGAGVGFGIGFGSSWEDKECSLRETARSFQALGLQSDAVAILCMSEHAAAAPVCKGLAAKPTPLPAATPATTSSANCYRDEVVARRMKAAVCQ